MNIQKNIIQETQIDKKSGLVSVATYTESGFMESNAAMFNTAKLFLSVGIFVSERIEIKDKIIEIIRVDEGEVNNK